MAAKERDEKNKQPPEYFLSADLKEVRGPFARDRLIVEGLRSETWVFSNGWRTWEPANRVGEIADLLPATPVEPSAQPTPAAAARSAKTVGNVDLAVSFCRAVVTTIFGSLVVLGIIGGILRLAPGLLYIGYVFIASCAFVSFGTAYSDTKTRLAKVNPEAPRLLKTRIVGTLAALCAGGFCTLCAIGTVAVVQPRVTTPTVLDTEYGNERKQNWAEVTVSSTSVEVKNRSLLPWSKFAVLLNSNVLSGDGLDNKTETAIGGFRNPAEEGRYLDAVNAQDSITLQLSDFGNPSSGEQYVPERFRLIRIVVVAEVEFGGKTYLRKCYFSKN